MAKEWYENFYLKNNNPDSLPNYDEYEKAFNLYQLRQICFFNINVTNFEGEEYIHNMFNKDYVYLKLLENLLYVKLKIIENKWTIDKINSEYNLADLKNINTSI